MEACKLVGSSAPAKRFSQRSAMPKAGAFQLNYRGDPIGLRGRWLEQEPAVACGSVLADVSWTVRLPRVDAAWTDRGRDVDVMLTRRRRDVDVVLMPY